MQAILGIALGVASAVHRGRAADHAVRVVCVVLASIPVFALGLVLLYFFGVRHALYIIANEAARVLGASGVTVAVREILPKVIGSVWVLATFELGKLILSLSALSFFGLGSKPPSPEWGTMLADSKAHFFRAPHLLLGPALFVFLTVLSLNLMGEGLRDRQDPFEIPRF